MTVRQDLTDGNSRLGRRIIDGAARVAGLSFLNLGDWRDADADRYLKLIRDPMTSLKNEGAKSTLAFYGAMAQLEGETFSRPTVTRASLATSVLRNGVDEATLWKRPFVTMRTALAQGKSMTEAVSLGAARAEYLASTEVQLARRGAGLSARRSNDRIVGYIRTLTGSENCALCYVASTQRYKKKDLLPIHPGCDCGEMPIYGRQDPGQVIDEMRLSKTHQAIEERFGISDAGAREPDYRRILIKNHGEIGPTLTVRGQSFTGPTNLKLKGTKAKPPANATNPDFFNLGLKTQALGEVVTDPAQIVKKTNPKWTTGRAYQNNCTNCVTAYDLRKRGYDVEAKPLSRGRATAQIVAEYADETGERLRLGGAIGRENRVAKNRITQHIIDNQPVGSHGFIRGQWGQSSSGHVWVWERTDTGVRYIEPQDGTVDPDYFSAGIARTSYFRVDDLTPTAGVTDFVEDSRR